MAKQLARRLEPHQPLFIEEPLLPGHIEELKTLYSQTTIPVALGERLFTRQDVRPYFEAGCIDIIQPDLAHSGGISEGRRIANMAETYDIGFAPHVCSLFYLCAKRLRTCSCSAQMGLLRHRALTDHRSTYSAHSVQSHSPPHCNSASAHPTSLFARCRFKCTTTRATLTFSPTSSQSLLNPPRRRAD